MNAANNSTAPAIIYVDGEEFIRLQDGDDFRAVFDETVRREGGEVALMVWKPRYGAYLREQMSITASVPTWAKQPMATA